MSEPVPGMDATTASPADRPAHREDTPFPGGSWPRDGRPALEVVEGICARILGRSEGALGIDLPMLGARSFDAARAAWLLEDAFGVDVDPAEVATLTPARIAELVERRRATQAPRPAPITTSQEGMIWHERLRPGSFNMAPLVRRHRGRLDHGTLAAAFGELSRRHQPLRTTIAVRRGRAVQVVGDPVDNELPMRDLSGLGQSAAEHEARRLIADMASSPFNLGEEAPFQPSLIRLGADDHLVVVRLHHSAFDDWSVGIYRRELSSIYEALMSNRPSPLGELPTDYSDFARGERCWMAGPAGTDEMAWWRSELVGAPLTTQLDIDCPPDAGANKLIGPSRPVSLVVPPELAGKLRALATHCRATMFMTLLAGFQVLAHRRTGQNDLLIATVVANRDQPQVEGLIGCFTKKVPLRLRLGGDPSFVALVGSARQALLGALTHHHLSYEGILQEVLGQAAAAHGVVPYVPIMFQGLVQSTHQLSLSGLASSPFGTSEAQGPGLHIVGRVLDRSSPEASLELGREHAGSSWGAGLYPATFLAISVLDDGEAVSCVAQGGFDRPSVEALMAEYLTLLAEVVAGPLRPVSQLVQSGTLPATGRRRPAKPFRGFTFHPTEMESALAGWAGVVHSRIALDPGKGSDEPSIVAELALDGAANDCRPPSLRQVQIRLWDQLPGCIWPSRLSTLAQTGDTTSAEHMILEGNSPGASPPPSWLVMGGPGSSLEAPSASLQKAELAGWAIAEAWTRVLGLGGLGRLGTDTNYWQCFSFLEALAQLEEEGIAVHPGQVARNRTILTLASDLAATGSDLRQPMEAQAARVAPDTPAPSVSVSSHLTHTAPQPSATVSPGAPGIAGDEDVIRVEGLSKIYPGGLKAVDGVDLVVRRGEIFGLLGPNGAGKTTTVGMITTLVVPTAGRVWVAGVDVVADPALAKQFMGVVPQANNLDNSLSVIENLYYHGRYFGMGAKAARATANEMLDRFRLGGRGNARVDHLSGGMARRLMLARALMQGPAIVFLDEPTAGLDPQSRLALWEIIGELHSEGQTILLTTHYMEEAERFCNRVAIMDHGRILALDTPAQLKRTLGGRAVLTIKGDGELSKLVASLEAKDWASEPVLLEGGVRVCINGAGGALSMVMAEAERSGVRVTDLAVMEDSLETVFINLTGRELRE
jgi:ABC-2 type transport system ATP-binding protein